MKGLKEYVSAKVKSRELETEITNQKIANKWLRDISGNPARTQGVLGQANFVTRAMGRAEARSKSGRKAK